MKAITTLLVLFSFLVLTGCDNSSKSKIENPMAGYVQALDKAKDAKAQLLESAEKQRKTLEELSQ